MSHQLDLEGVIEKLVLLQHFAYGSETYCRERLPGSEYDAGDEALDEYWGWAKSLVSIYILECSIRFRVLLDTVAGKPEAGKVKSLDAAARSGLVIGHVINGKFDLTIRETCNKIIHARKVIPLWAIGTENNVEFKYWSGKFELSGIKGSENWQLVLSVAQRAQSVERFLKDADELTAYVGQDWY